MRAGRVPPISPYRAGVHASTAEETKRLTVSERSEKSGWKAKARGIKATVRLAMASNAKVVVTGNTGPDGTPATASALSADPPPPPRNPEGQPPEILSGPEQARKTSQTSLSIPCLGLLVPQPFR
jgi:hypothetical protein